MENTNNKHTGFEYSTPPTDVLEAGGLSTRTALWRIQDEKFIEGFVDEYTSSSDMQDNQEMKETLLNYLQGYTEYLWERYMLENGESYDSEEPEDATFRINDENVKYNELSDIERAIIVSMNGLEENIGRSDMITKYVEQKLPENTQIELNKALLSSFSDYCRDSLEYMKLDAISDYRDWKESGEYDAIKELADTMRKEALAKAWESTGKPQEDTKKTKSSTAKKDVVER